MYVIRHAKSADEEAGMFKPLFEDVVVPGGVGEQDAGFAGCREAGVRDECHPRSQCKEVVCPLVYSQPIAERLTHLREATH